MTPIEINSPNLADIARAGDPVEVIDPATGQTFVLISAEQYQRFCRALTGDFDPREAYPLVDRIMQVDDVDDPLLEYYQQ